MILEMLDSNIVGQRQLVNCLSARHEPGAEINSADYKKEPVQGKLPS